MSMPSRCSASSRSASPRIAPACARLVMVIAGLSFTGCGSASPTPPTPVVLLDTTVTLVQGVNCNVGYVGAEFTGVAGKTVAISATGGASLTPLFILYAPDFATQLAGSSSSGAGAASLTFALTQSGLHHLSICDVNGVAGALRVTVQQQQ
jgi:hypothetical protein